MPAPQRHIQVLPYDPDWPQRFETEAARLTPIFGDNLIAIRHVGSTSIPGLAAKPIIDMLPEVRDIQRVDSLNDALAELGYEALGEYGISGRRYFRKLSSHTHLVHAHVFQTDNPEFARHIAFRDYLRAHPEQARAYGELKLRLAQRFPHSSANYQDGKQPWIDETEQKALQWHAKQMEQSG